MIFKSASIGCFRLRASYRRTAAGVSRYCLSALLAATSVAAALFIGTSVAVAEAQLQYSPIMPKASRSTLIDVERAGKRIVVVGERGIVLYSDDRGESWQQGKMPFFRMLTGVSFADDKQGWAVGHQSMVFHTRDGGETWERQLDGFRFQEKANADNLRRTRSAYETLAAELAATPDASRELELEDALFAFEDAQLYMEESVVPTNLHDVWFQDEQQGWAVGSFGRLIETRDGGKSWSDLSHRVATPDGFHLNSITGTGNGEIIIAGEGGVIFRSMDTGETWEQMDSGFYGSFFGVVYDPLNTVTTAFGLAGALYQSQDFGRSWKKMPGKIQGSLAGGTVTAQGNTVLVGPGGLVLIIDGGNSTVRQQVESDRMNHSSLLQLEGGDFIVVGAGGVKRVQIN